MRVHVVVPRGYDDPSRPSGGNAYDRRVCTGLAGLGWDVRVETVAGPPCGEGAGEALSGVLGGLPDGATVLVDGLLASPSAEAVLPHVGRLRVTVLLHMPLATAAGGAGARARRSEEGRAGGAGARRSEEERAGGAGARRPEEERAGGAGARRSEEAVLRAVAGVVATSGWTWRQVVTRFGVPPGRVRVAPPGVDPAPVASRPGTDGRLLCVGAFGPHKGQDVLVAALATLPHLDWECVLAGPLDRDPAFVAALRERIARHGLGDRVRLTGTLTGRALDHAYATAGVLVAPSRSETYGMVVTEALARGIPVIATNAGGLPEAVGHTPGGVRPGRLVRPDAPHALAAAVAEWLADPAYRDGLRTAAVRRRSALAGWDTTARNVAAALTATTSA